jgi:hypothetical protein
MEIQKYLLKFITRTNWILFFVVSVLGLIISPPDFAMGIIFGGLIVTINFHLLYRTLKKAFKPPHLSSVHMILAKHYVRFIVSGFIIFILVSRHYVDPLGLLIGLSVVVASIIFASIFAFRRLLFLKAENKKEIRLYFRELVYYSSLVFSVALSIFIGLAVGIYLDRRVFNTSPWLTVIFLGLGIVAGFTNIGLIIKKIRKF